MSAKLLSRLQQLGVSPGACAEFRALLQPAQPCAAHATIIRPGEPATHLHLVESGWAFSSKSLRDGRRQTTAVGLAGDLLDLDALLLGSCSFSVTALSACRIARVPLSVMLAFCEEMAPLAAALQRLAALDRRIADEWMVNLGRRSAAERIAHLVCEWAVRLDVVASRQQVQFAWPLTQADLADATGLSNVHVNRSLQTLRQQVGLHVDRRSVVIACWADIVGFAQFDAEYLNLSPRSGSRPPQQRAG